MKHFIRECILHILVWFTRGESHAASILMYHSIAENKAIFTVRPEKFEQQLHYLQKEGFTTVFFSELIHRLQHGMTLDKIICITFDDGYADNFTNALPLLIKYSMRASFFISTGLVGEVHHLRDGVTIPILSKEQLQAMHESGYAELLPHGHTHAKLAGLTNDEARAEIMNSYRTLKDLFDDTHKLFAYPSGNYSQSTIDLLKNEGFAAAVTVRPGLIRSGNTTLFELPRNHIDRETTTTAFAAAVSIANERYELLKRR